MAISWQRVAAGLYESRDGRFQIEKVTAVGEWDATATLWILNERRHGQWSEVVEGATMRELKKHAERM